MLEKYLLDNVDFLSRIEKEMRIISRNDIYFDTMLVSVDIGNEPKKYKNII